MSQWTKNFLFSDVNIRENHKKLHAWKLTNKVLCSGEHFVVKSFLGGFWLFFLFTSVCGT